MAKLPERPAACALGLAVGQTWLNADGYMVTVVGTYDSCGFVVRREPIGGVAEFDYRVTSGGISRDHRTFSNDLVERVARVYIAGPMSGHADLNFPAFHAAAKEYRKNGAFVISPAEVNGGDAEIAKSAKMTAEEYHAHWVKCMKNDISLLMTCDTIVMLPGWQKSRRAKLEHHIARNLGLTISYKD
jgi:hypothetical protein